MLRCAAALLMRAARCISWTEQDPEEPGLDPDDSSFKTARARRREARDSGLGKGVPTLLGFFIVAGEYC